MSSTKGKGLILLRTCNEILRRTSRSNGSIFCGEISLLLSKSFPSAERSGVNLKGDYNVDNVTSFNKELGGQETNCRFFANEITQSTFVKVLFLIFLELKDQRVSPMSFFLDFWDLQHIFLNPKSLLQEDRWVSFTKVIVVYRLSNSSLIRLYFYLLLYLNNRPRPQKSLLLHFKAIFQNLLPISTYSIFNLWTLTFKNCLPFNRSYFYVI
jgi:hypothetical protein